MSGETQLTPEQARRFHLYPCDGVRRFGVKGDHTRQQRTYAEAYEAIFQRTGCTRSDKGHRHLTRDGMLRLAALNALYTRMAGKFLTAKMLESMRERVARAKAKQEVNVTPAAP